MTTYTDKLQQSQAWQEKRQEKLAEAEYRCQECSQSKPLDIHHLIYIYPLGHEPLNTIEALCNQCHERRHRGIDLSHAGTVASLS